MGVRKVSPQHEAPGLHSHRRIRVDDRLRLVQLHGTRWTLPTVACVRAMPADTCDTIEEWEALFDEIDAFIRRAMR